MVALKSGEADRFIAAAGRGLSPILVYGPDEGLVRTRIRTLIAALLGAPHDPLALIDVEAEQLNHDPPLLLDEAKAFNMFGGKRVILVRQAGKLSKSIVQAVFAAMPLDAMILFQADDLARTSPLRQAAEASPEAAAIACYPPSASEIQTLIEKRLAEAHLTITPTARSYLNELLGSDYAVSRSEIDKLALYCAGNITIDLADIDAVITDSSATLGTDVIDHAFEGKLEAVETLALKSFQDGFNPSGLLVLALQHAFLLRRLMTAQQTGQFETAFRQERIFFRRQDRVRAQVSRWTLTMLSRAIDTLSQAQDQARRVSMLEDILVTRAFWSIALAASRKR